MDKEQFSLSIQQADNVSLRNGAANQILQLLQKQRYSNNENSVNNPERNPSSVRRMEITNPFCWKSRFR